SPILFSFLFSLILLPPPPSTLFPYTTLFRSRPSSGRPMGGCDSRLIVFVALAAVAASPPRAAATQRFGPVQLSGNLQSQNLVRHPDASTYEYIQNRNTA